ncbi:major capsid protein [Campylobacter sp. RM12920]|uniref:Major capsid protein n=1 Tax=Campylobacter californiensis TaxID=1032243 RepID=A0ABD4JIS5_9BACT|nr:major capsid protein [Campylobacter sp. RM12919]MBE2988972.1 major capsid protein [Campylobacter sp. RM12920]
MDELLKLFTVEKMTEIINQTKADQSFITDTFFTKWTPTLSNTHNLIITKGAGIILKSVSENGEHLVTKNPDETIISVPLPRFPQQDVLSASEMNLLKTLNTQSEQAKSLAAAIGRKLNKQKSNITNTIEYMAIGAIFGKVMDGEGNTLFELTANRKKVSISATTKLSTMLSEIEKAQVEVLGAAKPYIALVTRELYEELLNIVEEGKLLNTSAVKIFDKNGLLTLEIFGKTFMPYDATYKNTKGKSTTYMTGKKGVVVPLDSEIFEIVYTRANHTEAIGKAPTKFFAATPEVLPRGAGWNIVSESRPIPICNRLDAIVELEFA